MIRVVVVSLSLLTSTSAFAIDFSSPLLGQDGKPRRECMKLSVDKTKCEEDAIVTLGVFARAALDNIEEKVAPGEVVKRGALIEKLKDDANLELSVDELKLVKDQILKYNYPPSFKFQALKLIDPQSVKEK